MPKEAAMNTPMPDQFVPLAGDTMTVDEFRARERRNIDDPTIKVTAPTSLLSVIGRTYVNAMLNLARLREVAALLGVPLDDPVARPQAENVQHFARQIDEMQFEAEEYLRAILAAIGHIAFGENGEVVCVGPCEKHTVREYVVPTGIVVEG
jgi:hypothetical protein